MYWDSIGRADHQAFEWVARARTPWLDRVLPALSRSANQSLIWLAIAAVVAALGGRRGKRAAGRGVGGIALSSLIVNQVIKRLVRRPRPSFRRVPAVRRLKVQPLTTSFPSGHAASASAFATGMAMEWPVAGAALAPVAAAVAYSRTYVGVHYPADVLTGAAIGAAAAFATRLQFPTAPPEATRPPATAEQLQLEPDPDGARLGIVVKEDAGSPLDRDVPGELRRPSLRRRSIEVGADDDLMEAIDRAMAEREVLAVAGGDGSAAAGAHAALGAGHPLLVVPAGTLNHLARDLRIVARQDALDAYRDGEAMRIDVGEVAGKVFVNTLTFGAYPEMIERRERLQSRVGRWPAHLAAVLWALFVGRPARARDQRAAPGGMWMGFVGNCHHDPKGFAPAWRPRLDDGLLDLRLLDADQPYARLRLIASILAGRLTRSAAYEQADVERITIDSGRGEALADLGRRPRDGGGQRRDHQAPGGADRLRASPRRRPAGDSALGGVRLLRPCLEVADQLLELELLQLARDGVELGLAELDQLLGLTAERQGLAQLGLARVQAGDDHLEPRDGGLVGRRLGLSGGPRSVIPLILHARANSIVGEADVERLPGGARPRPR